MISQKEITKKQPLLDSNGRLAAPGWCRHNLYEYNPQNISANIMRLKEWDFYQISNGSQMVQINFFNISLASCATFGFVDLKNGRKFDTLSIKPFTPKKHRMNPNGDTENCFEFLHGSTVLVFDARKNGTRLYFKGKCSGKELCADFQCRRLPVHESITIATPFEKENCFFYTNKINCMPTEGSVTLGEERFDFSAENTFTVLDWARGVWPYKNMWYWANGSTRIDGKIFGFELTWGFGNESNATETALFYDGKCHKIGAVSLDSDPEKTNGWLEPWHFTDKNGRLDLTMTPFFDNYSNMMPLNLVGMRTHQVHGLWNGFVVLDSGEKLEIRDMYAFCEKVHNKW